MSQRALGINLCPQHACLGGRVGRFGLHDIRKTCWNSEPDFVESQFMGSDFQQLVQVARQVIDTDVLLGVEHFARGLDALPPVKVRKPAGKPPAGGGKRREYGPVTDKAKALDELRNKELRECACCGLNQTRKNLVFGEGDANAQLMIIGEAPGEDEDLTGRPFVGRAGKLLDQMISAMGLSRSQVYIANVLKCRPPDNRPPRPEEVAVCAPFLFRQIQIIQPKVILALGNPAVHTLLGKSGITRLRGQWHELPEHAEGIGGIPVMPTYHPSYVLRNYTTKTRGEVWQDLQAVMARLGIKKPG